MYTLFVILIVVAALLMIGIVLIQESKGGGLATGFASANSIAGVRQTTNFVEKATWTLAGAMVVLSIVCAYVAPNAVTDNSVIENAATEQAATNPNNVQGFGAAQQEQAPAADAQQAPAEETPVN
ncbi:MAG: preprotein translocase subunit SecG [Prevotella sp.]|nr:preprotein translocase subunit SecG [Candidatus Prevotella equi]